MDSIVQLITVLIIFAFVLGITYFTTRWIGSYQRERNRGRNIELLEAMRLNMGQYIQIVRIGDRYMALAVSKDNVTFLCSLEPEELTDLDEKAASFVAAPGFKKLLEQAGDRFRKKKGPGEDGSADAGPDEDGVSPDIEETTEG